MPHSSAIVITVLPSHEACDCKHHSSECESESDERITVLVFVLFQDFHELGPNPQLRHFCQSGPGTHPSGGAKGPVFRVLWVQTADMDPALLSQNGFFPRIKWILLRWHQALWTKHFELASVQVLSSRHFVWVRPKRVSWRRLIVQPHHRRLHRRWRATIRREKKRRKRKRKEERRKRKKKQATNILCRRPRDDSSGLETDDQRA